MTTSSGSPAPSPSALIRPGSVVLRPSPQLEALRNATEMELASKGVPLPACHRRVWAESMAEGHAGKRTFGFVHGQPELNTDSRVMRLESWCSRSIPGYRHLLLPHVGRFVSDAAFESALAALVDYSKRERVLRLTVEIFDSEAPRRVERARIATRLGLHPNPIPTQYGTTLRVVLDGGADRILSSFSRRCRRAIRKFETGSLRVDRVTEEGFDRRIQTLADETFQRTGGSDSQVDHDWAMIRRLQERSPDTACLVGIFDDRIAGPESLVGVAYGLHHGDFAVYEFGASSRSAEGEAQLGYTLVWELVRWAQAAGGTWFDLGGSWRDAAKEVAGIEAFKRSFSKDEVDVREEYSLEPSPIRAGFDRAARGLGARFRKTGVFSK